MGNIMDRSIDRRLLPILPWIPGKFDGTVRSEEGTNP